MKGYSIKMAWYQTAKLIREQNIIMYKGKTHTDSGYFYAPYIPIMEKLVGAQGK